MIPNNWDDSINSYDIICKPNAIDPPFADGFYMYQPFLVSHWGLLFGLPKLMMAYHHFPHWRFGVSSILLRQTRRIPQVYIHGRAERQDLDTDGFEWIFQMIHMISPSFSSISDFLSTTIFQIFPVYWISPIFSYIFHMFLANKSLFPVGLGSDFPSFFQATNVIIPTMYTVSRRRLFFWWCLMIASEVILPKNMGDDTV